VFESVYIGTALAILFIGRASQGFGPMSGADECGLTVVTGGQLNGATALASH